MNKSHIVFVMFGATGDLAKRKLFGSLYNIYRNHKDKEVEIISLGRTDMTNDEFQNYVDKATEPFVEKGEDFSAYLKNIKYSRIEITDSSTYSNLEKEINSLYREGETQIVMYLSIGYNLFGDVIDNLAKFPKLLEKDIKVIFEKPFGKDLESARQLNKKINSIFREEQIYRIDHYVGKEPVQNIMALRFGNIMFEPIWNSNYIDNIQIIASEKLGIEGRGGYYETSGALRDMLQNHLFQVLALITMEPPIDVYSEHVSNEKLKILKEIKIDKKSLVFGQYKGYKDEPDVANDSRTETFVAMKLFVNSWRFKDLPIYLKTGKKLKDKKTVVVIEFKEMPNIFYRKYGEIERNRIVIEVQPEEKITISYNLKKKDQSKHIEQIHSEFKKIGIVDNSYDKLLVDCMNSNKILFTNWDILEQSWHLVDDIVNCKNDCPFINEYEPYGSGPIASSELLEKDGRKWFF